MLINTTQIQSYIDVRLLCEFTSDDPGGVPTPQNQLATNQNLIDVIESASQDVISAVFRARQYTINEIVSLAGDQLNGYLPVPVPGTVTVSQDPANLVPIATSGAIQIPGIGADLRRVVAGLAWGYLLGRRELAADSYEKLAGAYTVAQAKLQQLTLGERIWQIPGADSAGLPSVQRLGSRTGRRNIARKVRLWGNLALPRGVFEE